MQFGDQMAIGGVRRGIRQGHAGQRVEITQAGAGQFQTQIEGSEIQRVGQGAGEFNAGVGDRHLSVQRKVSARILQGQQTADFALTREFLAVVLAFDLQGERVVLGRTTFSCAFFAALSPTISLNGIGLPSGSISRSSCVFRL